MNIYIEYLKAVKSWWLVSLVFLLFVSTQVFTSVADYFVSLWSVLIKSFISFKLNNLTFTQDNVGRNEPNRQ